VRLDFGAFGMAFFPLGNTEPFRPTTIHFKCHSDCG
jgi:hypothetical protein